MLPLSILILVFSKPKFSTLATIPTAIITFSALISSTFPAISMLATTSPFPTFKAFNDAEVKILMPCFSKDLRANFEISSSSTGKIFSAISTRVTSAPMLR